jgi:hypothetical protein
MKNWKTTILGIATLLVALGMNIDHLAKGEGINWTQLSAAVAGLGLMTAKDHDNKD